MSAASAYRRLLGAVGSERIATRLRVAPLRLGALLGAIGLVAATVTVLVELVTVTGDPRQPLYLAVSALLVATPCARYVRPRTAFSAGFAALVAGLSIYLLVVGIGFQPLGILADWGYFVTGMSVLEIQSTTVWVLAVTPAPVFLTWYFALRRRYETAALVGSAAVGFFVLTGDATPTVTLIGVISAAAVLGFGDLERGSASVRSVEYLVPLFVVIVLTPLFVSVVPSGAAPVALGTGSDTDAGSGTGSSEDLTMGGAVVETGDELDVVGSIRLSADVQFTVQAEQGQYWRTTSYDRYTGDGWLRVADGPGEGTFRPTGGPTRRVNQTVRFERRATVMPAAWRPFAVESETIEASNITTGPDLRPDRPLAEGETYTVSSAVSNASADQLRSAGTDYPSDIEETYTQLPSDVPDRVHTGTAELVADADTPHETAVTIERYLRTNKEYSLDVRRPDGDIADTFLYEMEAGYCTYFATTMVTMLRSQGIPARVAVGYNTGQQVAGDTWVVRGTNAHAWVEVYFPEYGWVTFDPTPQAALRQRQITELENTRQISQEFNDPEGLTFDTRQSWNVPAEGVSSGENDTVTNETGIEEYNLSDRTDQFREGSAIETANGSDGGAAADGGSDDPLSSVPSPERIAVFVFVFGLIAVGRRSMYGQRIAERVRAHYLPHPDAATEVERSFDRLLLVLEHRYRRRKQGETVREYLSAIEPDPRAHRVAAIRERARYRGDATEELAAEAVRLVDALARDA